MDREEVDRLVAQAEAEMPYQPYVDVGVELGRAILTVLTKRLGVDFATEVRAEILRQADVLSASDDPEDVADAPLVRELGDAGIWESLGVIAPGSEARDEPS